MNKQQIIHKHFKVRRDIKNFLSLFSLVLLFLVRCTTSSGQQVQNQENDPIPITRIPTMAATATSTQENAPVLITQIPTVAATSTLELSSGYFTFSMDEVSCNFEENPYEDFDHWADELTPGQSTVDELLNLPGVPEDVQRDGLENWAGYTSDDVFLSFSDGVLNYHSDPRQKLGEIVAHYGYPEMVVWKIPRNLYHLATYETVLVYPEYMVLFAEEEKVVRFTPDTNFRGSNLPREETFLARISSFEDDSYDRYEKSAWPCGE